MAYVSAYEHDVFVSYCHQDDRPLNEGAAGWVTTFARQLETELAKRLGTVKLQVWRDSRLAGNEPLTPQLLGAIRRSATLLVVMSPSYLNSGWCARERNEFLSFARECVGQGRVFIVRHRETRREEAPPELGDLVGFRFYAEDGDSKIDLPLDGADRGYVQRLYELSHHLKRKLKEMNEPPGPARAAAGACRRSVFLARSTDDLEGQEDELKAYLTQAGIDVLPRAWYPEADAEAFSAAMARDLAQSRVFVQLLSASRGRKVAANATGDPRMPRLQHEIALGARTSILQWRDPRLDFAQVGDPLHRELLDRARACRFEEFKRAVLEEARREAAAPRARPSTALTFVDADTSDLSVAADVGGVLADQGFDCFWPVPAGTPEQVRRDLEETLADCDGVIVVYGAAEPFWVRHKLLQIRKIVSQRERPATLALCMAPPPEDKELGFKLPNLLTLDCRRGVGTEALRSFVETVHARAA